MPTMKLTQLVVDRISRPKAGRVEYFDSQLPGFGLRVADSGHKSWVVMYRVIGKQRRYTIGTLAEVPKVEDARGRARDIMQEAARGNDPAGEKKAARAKARAAPKPLVNTVDAVTARFIEQYCKPKNRSWAETERILRNHVVSRWGDRELASITTDDVLTVLDELMAKRQPIAANRVLAAVRKMFNWAVDQRRIIPVSPASGLGAPGKETERERVLTDEELIRLWRAAETMGKTSGGFVRVLILTGQRRDEVATMRWQDLDLDKGLWTLPREATKGDRSHEVPLASMATQILLDLPRLGDFVFTTKGDRPISGYSKIKARADKLAGIEEDWRFHDLRRTAGTGMARLRIPVSTISRVLNHKEGGVTKIYNRYSYLDEKRQALETWAAHVSGLLSPSPGNVVTYRQTG
jgi:integrase